MQSDAACHCADSVARASRTVFPPDPSATTGRTTNQGFSTVKGAVWIPLPHYFLGFSAGLAALSAGFDSPGLPWPSAFSSVSAAVGSWVFGL